MSSYRLEIENPIPLVLLTPNYETKHGVDKKIYSTIEDAVKNEDNIFYGSFKTYGGTEKDINGVYSIIDTAKVKTWYRPDIVSNCAIGVIQTGAIYEILGEPENINMRNQFLEFKVKRTKGQS